MLNLLNLRLIALAVAGAAILAGGLWLRHEWNKGREAIVEAQALRAQVVALQESAKLVGNVMAQAESGIQAVEEKAGKIRIIYREAVRTDPDCAAWSRQPVACPLGAP
jgi:hypothetical protein